MNQTGIPDAVQLTQEANESRPALVGERSPSEKKQLNTSEGKASGNTCHTFQNAS